MQALHTTLEAKHRDSAARPWDGAVAQQVGVLVQIGELLNGSNVPPPELQQIMDQLKAMGPAAPTSVPPASVPSYPSQPTVPHPAYSPPQPPASYPNYAQPPTSMFPQHLTPPSHAFSPPPHESFLRPNPTPTLPIPAPTLSPQPPALPTNIADILRNLNTTGLLSHPRTPDPQTVKLPQTALDKYEDEIIAMDLNLRSLDMNQYVSRSGLQ